MQRYDSSISPNATESASEADQVAGDTVAKKQANAANPNNLKPIIQRQSEKGGGKPAPKQGKDLPVELPDYQEVLNIEGRGTVYGGGLLIG